MAAYTPKPGAARDASIDVTFTIEAPSAIRGTQPRTKIVTLVKFSSTSDVCPFGLTSRNGA